ncbi:MAG: hypothetical protein Q9M39_03890 [Sulfurovum sp.]|nr:hypothetical protein [Sulfurovum sp.]
MEIKETVIELKEQKLYAKEVKKYQTPYGEIELKRKVFAPLGSGKQVCPIEKKAHIIKTSTPKFAKMVSNKYNNAPAQAVQKT